QAGMHCHIRARSRVRDCLRRAGGRIRKYRLFSQGRKPIGLNSNLFDHFGMNSELIFLKQLAQPITIDQINRNRTVTRSLVRSLAGKMSGGDEKTLVRPPLKGSAEVSDLLRPDA